MKPDETTIWRTYTVPISKVPIEYKDKKVEYERSCGNLVRKETMSIDFDKILLKPKKESVEDWYVEDNEVVISTMEEK